MIGLNIIERPIWEGMRISKKKKKKKIKEKKKDGVLTDDTILAYSQKASPVYPSGDYRLDVWKDKNDIEKLISTNSGIIIK